LTQTVDFGSSGLDSAFLKGAVNRLELLCHAVSTTGQSGVGNVAIDLRLHSGVDLASTRYQRVLLD
jgi:hypothetical protein